MYLIEDDVLKVLFSEEQIENRCKELAEVIHKDYGDKNPILVCILNGSLPFLAKLISFVKCPMEIKCINAKSYVGTSSTGSVKIEKSDLSSFKDRHIIIVEDIVDTGLTINELFKYINSECEPASLNIMTLLYKKGVHDVNIEPKYVGFNVGNEFVIGFGLDYDEQYRNLPYIGVLKPEAIKK